MGAVLYGVNITLDEALFNAGWRYLALAGVIFAGGISYLGSVLDFGCFQAGTDKIGTETIKIRQFCVIMHNYA